MRSRTSRESGSHDGRSVRTAAAPGGAGLSPPSRHAARGAVASHRRGARGAAAPDHRASSRPAVGGRNRGRARAGRRHRALERDGLPAKPARSRFCTRTRSIVMQGLQLLVAATLGWQHPVVAPHLIVAPVQAQAALGALDALGALEVLDALDALDMDEGRVLQDEQDPTDSLWRAAKRALNPADYQKAAT